MIPMVPATVLFALHVNDAWYLLPLLVSISLVYGATRHELAGPILQHSFRAATWIVTFIGVVFLVLLAITIVL